MPPLNTVSGLDLHGNLQIKDDKSVVIHCFWDLLVIILCLCQESLYHAFTQTRKKDQRVCGDGDDMLNEISISLLTFTKYTC